jgi:GTPase SAR1 family protein
MVDIPLEGSTLVVGPSNAGKTRLTAQALDRWIDRRGPAGVIVLEFAPELERDGTVLGGRLTRFTTVPDGAFHGVLQAYAPRAESDDRPSLALARENAERAFRVLAAAPDDPVAVFVNDATIPLQADADRADALTDYCDRASVAVCNAFESDDLGVEDPVSRNERAALARLRNWADRVVELP